MSNALHIDSVKVSYLRNKNPELVRSLFGLIVSDDYESHELLEFTSASRIPITIDTVLQHVVESEYSQAFELIESHLINNKGFHLNGEYFEAKNVKSILEGIEQENVPE